MRKRYRGRERLTSEEVERGLMVTVLSDLDGKPYAAYSPVLDASVEIYARGPGRWAIRCWGLPALLSAEDAPWQVAARDEVLRRYDMEFSVEDGGAWREVTEEELPQAVLATLLETRACEEFWELMKIVVGCAEADAAGAGS